VMEEVNTSRNAADEVELLHSHRPAKPSKLVEKDLPNAYPPSCLLESLVLDLRYLVWCKRIIVFFLESGSLSCRLPTINVF